MSHTKFVFFLSAAVLLASTSLAQTGDWQAVKTLQPDTKISVRSASSFHNLCVFEQASAEHLVCEHILHGPRGAFIPSEYVYERKRIREVRLEHSDAANMATGAAIARRHRCRSRRQRQ